MAKVKRIIYPPVWLALGIITQFVCNEYYPVYRFTSALWQMLGGVLLVAGMALLVIAGGMFKRADTDMIPFREVSSLVTGGVYRLSRNPMYLGMALVLLGCAVTVGVVSALLVPPLFMIIIQHRFILPEEAMLLQLFPEAFPAYCQRVRRWL